MPNHHRGEIEAEFGGRKRILVLTLGALAELEAAFGEGDLVALAERFGNGRGEAVERYEIDILDGTTVRRVLTSTTAQVLYASADEIADFGTPLAAISLRVVQMSALVGRGYPAEAVVSVD